MNVTKSEKSAIALNKPTVKRRLVARWLVDRNSKLYCQWVVEDEIIQTLNKDDK